MVLTPAKLIESVHAAGGRFMIDGDRLGVSPRTSAEPFVEEIRKHKIEILDLLRTGKIENSSAEPPPALPAGVRLIRWEPATGPVQLPPCSVVTDPREIHLFDAGPTRRPSAWQRLAPPEAGASARCSNALHGGGLPCGARQSLANAPMKSDGSIGEIQEIARQ